MPRRPDGHSRAHAAPPRKARAPAASSSTDKRRWRRSGRCLTTHFLFVVPNIWFYYIRFVGQSPNRWGTHGNSRFVRAARGGAHFFAYFRGGEVRRGGAPKDGSPGGSIKAAPLSAGEMRRDQNPDSYRRGCIFSYSGGEVCRATVRPGPRVRGALARRLKRNPAYFLSTTPDFAPV